MPLTKTDFLNLDSVELMPVNGVDIQHLSEIDGVPTWSVLRMRLPESGSSVTAPAITMPHHGENVQIGWNLRVLFKSPHNEPKYVEEHLSEFAGQRVRATVYLGAPAYNHATLQFETNKYGFGANTTSRYALDLTDLNGYDRRPYVSTEMTQTELRNGYDYSMGIKLTRAEISGLFVELSF